MSTFSQRSEMTVGELRTLISAMTGLEYDQVGPVVIVAGMINAGRSTVVVPPMLDDNKPDWKQAVQLMAAGILHVTEDDL